MLTDVQLLMVGICGGVWSTGTDLRLGDVVVSQPTGAHGGVVAYDFGKVGSEGFHRTGALSRPPQILLKTLNKLRSDHQLRESKVKNFICDAFSRIPTMVSRFKRPGPDEDRLFQFDNQHIEGDTCDQCDLQLVVERDRRPDEDAVLVWYGNIASGDKVMKHAGTRDFIARKENVIAFEMEAAGLMNNFPCAVIRGVCDYADSHKNKQWQPFAAIAAAAYAKELLLELNPYDVQQERPLGEHSFKV